MRNALKGHPAEDLARFCFSKLRFLPATLKDDLRRRDLWEDLAQELYCIALEGWRQGKTAREMGGVATRELRAFLRAYGYIRHRQDHVEGYIKPERLQSTFGPEEDDPDAVWERVLANAEPVPTPYEAPRGLEEAILGLLREHPEGLSQCQVNRAFDGKLSTAVVIDCCQRLVMRGLVTEVPRTRRGPMGVHPSPLLFLDQDRFRQDGAMCPAADGFRDRECDALPVA